MRKHETENKRCIGVMMALVLGLLPVTVLGVPPSPPNDLPENAEELGALPALVFGTSVLANNDIFNTGLPGLSSPDYTDGPDVFYKFTPAADATYRIQLAPWEHAPLRSSDRRFVIYVFEDLGGGSYNFIAGVRAPGDARPVNLDVALTSGVEYKIGIDHDDIAHDNFPFTLIVDQFIATNPDACASAISLPSTLPVVLLNNIDGAANDFGFTQSNGRCSVANTTPAAGNDHVYEFIPPYSGDFAIELISSGFDGVLYVDDSCGPFFPDGCYGASNHSTGGTSGARHEFVVVTLEAGSPYYVYVDNGSTTAITGPYALIIDAAVNYEVTEVEPNDTAAAATVIGGPLHGGQLVGPTDEDWWSIVGLAGDRVYAWVNNGGSANSTLDTDLGLYGTDGSTLIEFDDEDGDGADGPIEDWRYVYGTDSAVLAGVRLPTDGTYYLRVTDQSATGTVHRYRFHVGVEPGTRSPLPESEPNGTIETANFTVKHYYAGVIDVVEDRDVFGFDVEVGDRVFIAFDGDPERDSTGQDPANTDPNAFHGKLVIYDPAGDMLISDISDANSIQSPPDYPAQGGFFIARTAGRHYVEVGPQSSASQVGPTETYVVAIFINDAAPQLDDEIDPVISLDPDYANDVIHVTATDAEVGDSGVCSVELLNSTNMQIVNVVGMPGPVVTFDIVLVNPAESGSGALVVTDCIGNTAITLVTIDVYAPVCDGVNLSNRSPKSLQDPIHVPDNDPLGANGEIEIAESGLIADVNVTMTIDALDTGDLDIYLVSPTGTIVELVTDRMSSSGYDMVDTTFDDDGTEILPILGSAAPYTGTWLPEDPAGLAKLNGEDALGTWRLNVVDDASSEDFGATLVRWSLDIEAGFAAPQRFAGTATDEEGIASIVLTDAVNVELTANFTPGETVVHYTVALMDSGLDGSGTITVADMQENTCQSAVAIAGYNDAVGPSTAGEATTELVFKQEVQQVVPASTPAGVVSTIVVPDSFVVGEVEVALMVDSQNQGRMAATLTHDAAFASLVNRIGMDERASSGNTKNSFDVLLDDDAPQADDIHMEPALGTIPTLGLHQPDGRGEYFGDGISTDHRDNMLFTLAGSDSAGAWDLLVADTRMMSSSENRFRRWALILKSPCGGQRYVGRAIDLAPGSGICAIELAAGATNLTVVADFTPGDEVVDYRVELIDSTQPGSGTLEISDCAGNVTTVDVNLATASADTNNPAVSGAVNLGTFEFEGAATDNGAGDTGIYAVELAPWQENLQFVSVTPDPPNGAGSVAFVIGLVDPMANGRGYVRVTDGCGHRSYTLVEIDALGPVCTGSMGHTKRYLSSDLPQPIPDYNPAGVTSSIVVPDIDVVEDVNITLNIRHGYDDDIDVTLVSPMFIDLFSDVGNLGNDFTDTVLDDEAAAPIPDLEAEAPFTGVYQPEAGPALFALDGVPALGTYSLRVVDDKTNDTGDFLSWSLTIESSTFPLRYDGRAGDGRHLDTGICSIELLPGSYNLTLVVDAFVPGDAIVRYSVTQTNPLTDSDGVVRVTDCAGNTCDVPIAFGGDCGWADLDNDGDIDELDFWMFADAFGRSFGDPHYSADADHDGDGIVSLVDYQAWLSCYQQYIEEQDVAAPGDRSAGHQPDAGTNTGMSERTESPAPRRTGR